MLTMNCEITVGKWRFTYVTELTINWSVDMFTRTAFIKLPQKFYDNTAYNLFNEIAIGDQVEIKTGYYPNLIRRFVGYVSKRVPNSPIEIYCECESFQYKQKIVEPETFENTTLGEILDAIYPGKKKVYDPTRKIGNWRISKSVTFLKVLDTLRQTFGISAFWDNDKILNIDQQFNEISAIKGRFYYDTPKANIISLSNMTYQDATEFNQVVKGVSMQDETGTDGQPKETIEVYSFYNAAGKIVSSELYEGQGNINNFKRPYLTFKELSKLTENLLKNLNFTGYRGGFQTFGEPVINVNDDIEIVNNKQAEMSGRYRVRSIGVYYGLNGYRQDIQLSRKTGEVVV